MGEWLVVPSVLALLALYTTVSVVGDRAVVAALAGRPTARVLREPFEDAARLMVQRRRTTTAPDALLWRVGGGGLVVTAVLMMAVVPVGDRVVADLAVGVVWFNAMDVLLWALVWLAGWGAASAVSMVGGYRFLGQALAYELPLMFALIPPAVAASSLDVREVVASQGDRWNVVEMPVAFGVFLLCVAAFSSWGPFAAATDPRLGGGVLAETSGVDRLLLLVGRHALVAAGAAFSVPLFLGGGAGPVLPDVVWQVLKTVAVLAVLVQLRRRLPVVRPERFADVGWVVLVPLTLAQVLVTSLVLLAESP